MGDFIFGENTTNKTLIIRLNLEKLLRPLKLFISVLKMDLLLLLQDKHGYGEKMQMVNSE